MVLSTVLFVQSGNAATKRPVKLVVTCHACACLRPHIRRSCRAVTRGQPRACCAGNAGARDRAGCVQQGGVRGPVPRQVPRHQGLQRLALLLAPRGCDDGHVYRPDW